MNKISQNQINHPDCTNLQALTGSDTIKISVDNQPDILEWLRTNHKHMYSIYPDGITVFCDDKAQRKYIRKEVAKISKDNIYHTPLVYNSAIDGTNLITATTAVYDAPLSFASHTVAEATGINQEEATLNLLKLISSDGQFIIKQFKI